MTEYSARCATWWTSQNAHRYWRCYPLLGITSLSRDAAKIPTGIPEVSALINSPALKRLGPLIGGANGDDLRKLRSVAVDLLKTKTPGAILACLPDVRQVLPKSMSRLSATRQAALAIASAHDQELVAPLAAHLAFSPAYHEDGLAKLLMRELGEASVAATIATVLWEAHLDVLVAVAESLGHIGGTQAMTVLMACVANPQAPTKSAADCRGGHRCDRNMQKRFPRLVAI